MTQSCGVEFRRKLPERSFPHAEPGEDALHDVLPGGTSGELSQGVEPVFDVRHHGVGGQSGGEGLPRPADGFQRPADGVLLADVRQQAPGVLRVPGGAQVSDGVLQQA